MKKNPNGWRRDVGREREANVFSCVGTKKRKKKKISFLSQKIIFFFFLFCARRDDDGGVWQEDM